ncbi:hypothetical protein JOE48_005018 [Methylobacterium sp. PvR107]|nr:hypothetical protein [Methylobacterium sp. PvR107]
MRYFDAGSSDVISIERGVCTAALPQPLPVWIVVSDLSRHPIGVLAADGGHPPLVRGTCTACATRGVQTVTAGVCPASDRKVFSGRAA